MLDVSTVVFLVFSVIRCVVVLDESTVEWCTVCCCALCGSDFFVYCMVVYVVCSWCLVLGVLLC